MPQDTGPNILGRAVAGTLNIDTEIHPDHRALMTSLCMKSDTPSPSCDSFPSPTEMHMDSEQGTVLSPTLDADLDNSKSLDVDVERAGGHASLLAVHGSALPSPAMGRRRELKDGDFFHFPLPKGRDRVQTSVNASDGDDIGNVAHHRRHSEAKNDKLDKLREVLEHRDGNQEINVKSSTDEVEGVPVQNGRVIAIDFDDVCCQHMLAICEEHNVKWGTDITPEDMESYFYFQNRGWGTHAEVARKLQHLDHILPQTLPVPGFAAALRKLHKMGHPIHIITSRPEQCKTAVLEWLGLQGITVGFGDDDVIAAAWFTHGFGNPHEMPERGDTASAEEREAELERGLREMFQGRVSNGGTGKRKLKIMRAINAALLIDDYHGNLEPMLNASPPIPCLLFGSYKWNQSAHPSGTMTPVELMSFEERQKAGHALPRTPVNVVEGLYRTETWDDVVEWVRKWDREAQVGGE